MTNRIPARYRLPSGRDGRTMYDGERWAELAREAGFEPFDTESSARQAFAFCAERIEELEAHADRLQRQLNAIRAGE